MPACSRLFSLRCSSFFIILILAGVAGAGSASTLIKIDVEALRKALGGKVDVFEITAGEAKIGLPFLKRIEITADTALLTVRNEGKMTLAPRIEIQFFNDYGMRIANTVA